MRPGRATLEELKLDRLDYIARQEGRLTVTGAPQGYDAYVAAEAARRRKGPVLFVAPDDVTFQWLKGRPLISIGP